MSATIKSEIENHPSSHIKIGFTDTDGVMLGKYLNKKKALHALDQGFSFCDVALGWDIKDQLYDNTEFTGWHTGYPDATMRILPETKRVLPFENNTLFFLSEFTGTAESICPRGVLRQVLKRADTLGYNVKAAFEYEFFVFNETLESAKKKDFKRLSTFTEDWCGYSMLRTSVQSEFHHGLLELCEAVDCPIEGLHTETGPGVIEAAIQVDDALSAADKAVLFKSFTKIYAQRQQKLATFMAKWSEEYPGQSGHIHISLTDKNTGKNSFFEAHNEYHMSDVQHHFIAGIQKLLPSALALIAPTINSYKRLIPGFWAPTESSWGIENRTTAIRAIPGSDASQRVEIRAGAADANPYLALAAMIASGLAGIEQQWLPEAPLSGNAYDQAVEPHLSFPRTLSEAAHRLKESSILKEYLGTPFVQHFAASREWEVKAFQKHISQWELERYLELI